MNDLECSFHHCADPVNLAQACLSAGKVSHPRVNLRGGAVKHVQASLSAWKDIESSFHHFWSPVWLVQACLFIYLLFINFFCLFVY